MIRQSDLDAQFGFDPLQVQEVSSILPSTNRLAPQGPEGPGFMPDSVGDFFSEVGEGVADGAIRATHGIYTLVDKLALDLLPDWNDPSNPALTPESGLGRLISGFTQFALPYATGTFGLGVAAKMGRGGRMVQWLDGKANPAGVKAFMDARKAGRTRQAWFEAAMVSAKGGVGRATVKGGLVDFVAFHESEARMSDLVQSIPELQNPVTAWLASDEDDSFLEGRIKNVLEGAGMGVLIDGVTDVLRSRRAYNRVIAEGGSDEQAVEVAMKTLDDSKAARVEAKRIEEDVKIEAEDKELFEVFDAEGNVEMVEGKALREEAEADASTIDEAFEALLEEGADDNLDAITNRPFLRDSFRTTPSNLMEPPSGRIPRLGFMDPMDEEGFIRAKNIARQASSGEELDNAINPRTAPADDLEFKGTERTDSNQSMRETGVEYEDKLTKKLSKVDMGIRNNLENERFDLARKMSSPKYVASLVRAIERNTKEVTKSIKSNKRTLARAATEAGRLAQMPADKLASAILSLGDAPEQVALAGRKAMLFRVYSEMLGRQMKPRLARLAKQTDISHADFKDVYNVINAFTQIQQGVRNVFSEMGRGLQSASIAMNDADILARLHNKDFFRPLQEMAEAAQNPKVYDPQKAHELMVRMSKVVGSDNPVDNMLAIKELLDAPVHRKLTKAVQEYHINALLSGISTHMVNIGSAAAMTVWRPLEAMIGAKMGMITADEVERGLLKQVYDVEKRSIMNLFGDLQQAWRMTKQSGGMTSFSSEGMTEAGRVSTLQTLADSAKHKSLASPLAGLIQKPTQALQWMDSYFKTVNGLSRSKAIMHERLIADNINPSDIPGRIEEMQRVMLKSKGDLRAQIEISNMMKSEGLDVGAALDTPGEVGGVSRDLLGLEGNDADTMLEAYESAVQAGKEVTFTTDLDLSGGFGKGGALATMMTNQLPLTKFFLPFVRTPVNIVDYGWDHTVGAVIGGSVETARKAWNSFGLGKEWHRTEESFFRFQRQLSSSDPYVRSQARARFTMALAGTSAVMMEMSKTGEGAEGGILTGAGPADPDAQKVLRESGWQPYSIRIGDRYVSYSRLDPVATSLGILVDASLLLREANQSDSKVAGIFQAVTMATTVSITNNLTNKSYLKGFQDMMEFIGDPQGEFEGTAGGFLGSFVPSIVASAEKVIDPEVQATRSVLDRAIARIPFYSGTRDVRRNLLGEKVRIDDPNTQFFLPTRISNVKDSVVGSELARFAYGFSEANPDRAGVDLLDPELVERGQTAYDRYVELSGKVKMGGRDLRQALRVLIQSSDYQRLDPEEDENGEVSPRIGEIQKVIRKYRNAAWRELQRERPNLRQTVKQVSDDRKARRRGRLTL